ncbi:chaplin [Embleya sp. NBC_00896]|nr:chaplin [Embleya sp. NBC_00896]
MGKVAFIVAAGGGLVLAGAGGAMADSEAQGAAVGSPGVLSGNNIQVPIHIPINLCGNTVNVIAALNPTFGNTCINA